MKSPTLRDGLMDEAIDAREPADPVVIMFHVGCREGRSSNDKDADTSSATLCVPSWLFTGRHKGIHQYYLGLFLSRPIHLQSRRRLLPCELHVLIFFPA
jgi:hypothetical protein